MHICSKNGLYDGCNIINDKHDLNFCNKIPRGTPNNDLKRNSEFRLDLETDFHRSICIFSENELPRHAQT